MSHREQSNRTNNCLRRARWAWAADTLSVGIVVVGLSLASAGAHAQLATYGAQLTQNAKLGAQVIEQVNTVTEMMTTIKKMEEQFKQMLKAGASVTGAITGAGQQGLGEEVKRLTAARNAFNDLYKDVNAYNQTQQARFVEASTKGLSYAKYLEYEREAIAQGNKRAIARVQQEQRMLDAIKEDQALASQWASQIGGTEGIHQSVGMLNVQLNRYLQQQGRVTQLLAQAQGTDKAVEEAEKARLKANNMELSKRAGQYHDRTYMQLLEGVALIDGNKNDGFDKNVFRSNYSVPNK